MGYKAYAPQEYDLFTEPFVKANGERRHMTLTCTCPNCGQEYKLGKMRDISHNPFSTRAMGESRCPYCQGVSHIDTSDLTNAIEGAISACLF
jgi:ssDNA-binding Zn-finger/Zn-ribbon topoisomerase 1